MKVYGLTISNDNPLSNIDLDRYAQKLAIKNFRGVFMRDTLPRIAHQSECGIVNFNTSNQMGSHWVCYFKDGMSRRIYFDSFGQETLDEIQKYLKTKNEYESGDAVIQRNTDIVQHVNTHVCGHLCLYVLTSLTRDIPFQTVLNNLNDRYRDVGCHRLLPIPSTLKKKWPQKPCIICRKDDQRRRDTRHYCNTCNVALCKNICFETHHKLDDQL